MRKARCQSLGCDEEEEIWKDRWKNLPQFEDEDEGDEEDLYDRWLKFFDSVFGSDL